MEIRPEEFASFTDWFQTALWFFVITVPILAFLAIFISYLNSAVRRGPVEAFYRVAHVIFTAAGRDIAPYDQRVDPPPNCCGVHYLGHRLPVRRLVPGSSER